MESGVVFLPKVFPPGSVELGQLVSNPLYPTVRAFFPAANTIPSNTVSQGQREKDFKTTVLLRKEGYLHTKVLRLLEAKRGVGQADYLQVSADASDFRVLLDADRVFTDICRNDQNARIWMQDMAVYGKPFFLVVGIQTVENASFARMAAKAANAETKISTSFDPSNLLTMQIGGSGNDAGLGAATAKTSGVLGIQVRRVVCQI